MQTIESEDGRMTRYRIALIDWDGTARSIFGTYAGEAAAAAGMAKARAFCSRYRPQWLPCLRVVTS
jgi:hypothetical protein